MQADPGGPGKAAFKQAVGRFASGVTIITTALQDEMHGITASAFTSLSLDPLQVLVCIRNDSRLTEMIATSGHFAVNILSSEKQDLSNEYARPGRPPARVNSPGLPFRPGVTGAPVLEDALAYVECGLAAVHPGGDHTIFVGDVRAAGHNGERSPLVYWCGSYCQVPAAS
ncbi:MAG: flavin reductase family protein [Dehalococcoidia bacterium]|nr:flavin reductase family protein [Dehalococcoidia bacterium]